ncbi:MAG: alpha/beta hydrolase [Flavobacteriaceae bacterium]|nr:alpha/beta hydrolase [Flavobacteriaceae bacterium]
MKNLAVFLLFQIAAMASAQEIVTVPHKAAETVQWTGDEKEYFSALWETQVVTNTSIPTLQIFKPDPQIANGTSVIIAPGGGLYAHSIEKEGTDVANWLNQKGITAFVLKYRLVPTGEDGVKELMDLQEKVVPIVKGVLPYSIKDGINAIAYVRANAKTLGIDPLKVGFMGFSAGGSVTLGVIYNTDETTAPNFIVPIYAWTYVLEEQELPEEAPPMFMVCAADDPLMLAPTNIKLYAEWIDEGHVGELHMYARGGHGFGMQAQGKPSDKWIDRFYEWSVSEGLTIPKEAN